MTITGTITVTAEGIYADGQTIAEFGVVPPVADHQAFIQAAMRAYNPEREKAVQGLVEAVKALKLARFTDSEELWERATELSNAALANFAAYEASK